MGSSLGKYLELKIPSDLHRAELMDLYIDVGSPTSTRSGFEVRKPGKKVNFRRPIFLLDTDIRACRCHVFPGISYVSHYASIAASYFSRFSKELTVHTPAVSPTLLDSIARERYEQGGLPSLPVVDVIVLGKVEQYFSLLGFPHPSHTEVFVWSTRRFPKSNVMLLGVTDTIWGELAGVLASQLMMQCKPSLVIYTGKLGSLDERDVPNASIATGSRSSLDSGEPVIWNNVFAGFDDLNDQTGDHVTCRTPLQESVSWVEENRGVHRYVDPEIGYIAKACAEGGVSFSYLHVVSDNLVSIADGNLANERVARIAMERHALVKRVGTILGNFLYSYVPA